MTAPLPEMASPDDGWEPFGTHAGDDPVPIMEFIGCDEAGMPTHERVREEQFPGHLTATNDWMRENGWAAWKRPDPPENFHVARAKAGLPPIDLPVCPVHVQYAVCSKCPECGWRPPTRSSQAYERGEALGKAIVAATLHVVVVSGMKALASRPLRPVLRAVIRRRVRADLKRRSPGSF